MADDKDVRAPSAPAPSPAVTRFRGRRRRPANHSLTTNKYDTSYAAGAIRRRAINSPKKKSRREAAALPRPPDSAAVALAFGGHDNINVGGVDGAAGAADAAGDGREDGELAEDAAARDAIEGESEGDDSDNEGGDALVGELLATYGEDNDSGSGGDGGDDGEEGRELQTQPPAPGNDESSPDVDEEPAIDPQSVNTGEYLDEFVEIPDEHRRIIEQALKEDWGVDRPREFQIQAIHRAVFFDNAMIHIAAKTGSGKSAIALATASLRRGIAVCEVPLLGLGTDQVAKAMFIDRNIEAYHVNVDEHRYSDAKLLGARLRSYTEEERQNLSVILFLSPNALKDGTDWTNLLKTLAEKGYISMACIDEAHTVSLQGRSFRPEFNDAMRTIKLLRELSPVPFPRIAMSATFRQSDQDRISDLIGERPDLTIWTDMNKRRTFVEVNVSGNPCLSCKNSMKIDYGKDPDMKSVWYTNSKKKAEETLVPSCENIIDALNLPEGEAMAFTGGCGLMEKVFLMAAFSGEKELFERPERDDVTDADTDDASATYPVPHLLMLAATAAANAGISSNKCYRAYRIGPPLHMYDFVQEMGRVDRDRSLLAGVNRYEVHLCLRTFASMYVRIMQGDDASERERQLVAAYEVLSFMMTPTDCFHSTMEAYFERDTSGADKLPCGQFCSYCTGFHSTLTGTFRRMELTALLAKNFQTTMRFDAFLSCVKDNIPTIYEPNQVPNREMGKIHALCLQLLATGLIELTIPPDFKTQIGTGNLLAKHVHVKGGTCPAGMPAFLSDSYWKGLTWVKSALDSTTAEEYFSSVSCSNV